MAKVEYPFIPIPRGIIGLLDADCFLLFITLYDHYSRLRSIAKDGWMSLPNITLEKIYWSTKQLEANKSSGGSRRRLDNARKTLSSYGIIEFRSGSIGIAPEYRINFCLLKELKHFSSQMWQDLNFKIYSGDNSEEKPLPFYKKSEELDTKDECFEEMKLPF